MLKIDVVSVNERLDNKVENGLLLNTEIHQVCQRVGGSLSSCKHAYLSSMLFESGLLIRILFLPLQITIYLL